MERRSTTHPARHCRGAALLLLASLVALGACEASPPGGSQTPGPSPSPSPTAAAEAACSASAMSAEVVPQKLPDPVAALREDIVAAAEACDYARLQRMALQGEPGFTYSFGDGGSPAAFWEQAESTRADEPMRLLIATLNLPFAITEREAPAGAPYRMYVWPSAHRESATEEDWRAVEALYGQQAVVQMRRQGSGFLGYRVGITEDGDWVFFVAGD